MCGELRIPIAPRAIAYHILDHSSVRRTRTKEHRPVKSPLNRGKENECLEQMLDDGPSPIILDPASANCFRERHADSCAEDKHSITERQRPRVLREHGGKPKVERCALCFYASNIRADCPYED